MPSKYGTWIILLNGAPICAMVAGSTEKEAATHVTLAQQHADLGSALIDGGVRVVTKQLVPTIHSSTLA